MENVDRFPNNILRPTNIYINNREYDLYKANFRSITDLYHYVKSNPIINDSCFPILASERESFDFAGEPYDTAVESIVKPVKEEYADFIKLQRKLDSFGTDFVTQYVTCKSISGSVIDIPSYVSGSPLCYVSEKETYEPKFIRLNVLLSYYWGTSKNQVKNRALIITALINALEKEGYYVDINAFAISKEGDEIIDINVNLKNSNNTLNKSNIIKALCYVEFFRRVVFRVKETMPVKDCEWGDGYGSTCEESFSRKVLKISKDDLFIDQPRELGIWGKDLILDFENAIEYLKLDNKINVKESKKEIETEIKKLSLRR